MALRNDERISGYFEARLFLGRDEKEEASSCMSIYVSGDTRASLRKAKAVERHMPKTFTTNKSRHCSTS
jgi:hypothetical protein